MDPFFLPSSDVVISRKPASLGTLTRVMFLPFLKEKKWPRMAKPMDSKSYGLSASESLEDYCIEELMDAAINKNVSAFLASLEALLLNCFEDEQPNE